MPRPAQSRRGGKSKQKSPQERMDEFWDEFTTKAPGKVTNLIPHNNSEHAAKAAKRASAHTAASSNGNGGSSSSSSTGGKSKTTQASYEEAAAVCRTRVARIVRECRRVNQKYRDPHFDLEFDLKTGRRDCLDALSSSPADYDDADTSDSDSDASVRPWTRSKSKSGTKPGSGSKPQPETSSSLAPQESASSPRGRDPCSRLMPRAVKRVGEIFDEPRLYIDGATARDVRQGRDGDCWLMAALCVLSNKPGLIERVCVAHDQDVGVYGFVFHRDGAWFSEIIDDKLYLTKPDYDEVNIERVLWDDRDRANSEETYRRTYQSGSGALYFAQCADPNETWLPLLEKAYAKAHGDYAAIEGGFTGEGVEDLTGGVTSELTTTDILDKEYFWKEELMKVNEQFLFGCSTGLWGLGWGDRRGIKEGHAYSIMRAVEMDGERLVLLKNPWGKGEWKGAWSDGSKEWTAEWLQKLDHRFGDDGAFWMSYDDLLRKYQAFDRTRLFSDPGWTVDAAWATLSVPWMPACHATRFAFTLARPGTVVLVLSQLDDRYFRGLEGQYRFKLGFRVHAVPVSSASSSASADVDDHDDHDGNNPDTEYLVRSPPAYRMDRSVNVELDLPAGQYHVVVQADARRYNGVMPAEAVVRANAARRRDKLRRVGLAYDAAHARAGAAGAAAETPEECAARKAREERRRLREREEVRRRVEDERRRRHYYEVKAQNKRRERAERRRARRKAKMEGGGGEGGDGDGGGGGGGGGGDDDEGQEKRGKMRHEKSPSLKQAPVDAGHLSDDSKATTCSSSSVAGAKTPSTSTSTSTTAGGEVELEMAEMMISGTVIPETEQSLRKGETPEKEDKGDSERATSTPQAAEVDAKTESNARVGPSSSPGAPIEQAAKAKGPDDAKTKRALLLLAAVKEEIEKLVLNDDDGSSNSTKEPEMTSAVSPLPPPPPPPLPERSSARPSPNPNNCGLYIQQPTQIPNHCRPWPNHMRTTIPRPQPRGARPSEEDSDDDDSSTISSLSDLSERELDYEVEMSKREAQQPRPQLPTSHYPLPPPPPPPLPPQPPSSRGRGRGRGRGAHGDDGDGDDEYEKEPWNAVVVVGLRVYYRAHDAEEASGGGGGGEDRDKKKDDDNGKTEGDDDKKNDNDGNGDEAVTLRVLRPLRYGSSDDDESSECDGD